MNPDYRDILQALVAQNARFLVVGAHALAAHGYPRATVDIDLWVDRTPDNAARVWRALAAFGAPLADLGIQQQDLTRPDVVVQLGLAPSRIDFLRGAIEIASTSTGSRGKAKVQSERCAERGMRIHERIVRQTAGTNGGL